MLRLRARYVFPVDRPPIENGLVVLDGDRIVAVEPYSGQADTRDLGDVAILPGLVNAHTHLELSACSPPLGRPGMAFPAWIREVLAYRFRCTSDLGSETAQSHAIAQAVEQGLQESASYGVTTIGDITPWQPSYPARPITDLTAFLELRALHSADVTPQLETAQVFAGTAANGFRAGLSPHAPYTVHRDLLEGLVELAADRGLPLAMHLAESPEELELLRTGRGPFYDLLHERGVWEDGALGVGWRILDYLERLSRAKRALIIHGNYLSDDEIQFLARHSDRMSVVYCPRTHAYFDHAPYPLVKMLNQGVRVALGTDSRASNPDLDLRQEMRFVSRHHAIAPVDALRLGTLNGAAALGLAQECGSLTPGKRANLAIITLPDRHVADPHELAFDDTTRVVVTICRGRVVYAESDQIDLVTW